MTAPWGDRKFQEPLESENKDDAHFWLVLEDGRNVWLAQFKLVEFLNDVEHLGCTRFVPNRKLAPFRRCENEETDKALMFAIAKYRCNLKGFCDEGEVF